MLLLQYKANPDLQDSVKRYNHENNIILENYSLVCIWRNGDFFFVFHAISHFHWPKSVLFT